MRADFAIITIREDEYKALASRLRPAPQRGASGRHYGISQIQTKDGKSRTVAIARCEEQGPQPAQQLAYEMIMDLSPSLLLVVGIAGGVPDADFTLGDVIVSSRIHDFGVNAYKPGKIEWDMRGGNHPPVSEIIAALQMYETDFAGWNAANSLSVARPAFDVAAYKGFDLARMTAEDKQRIFDGEPPESWQRKILDSLKWHFADPPQRSAEPLYTSGSIGSSGSLVRDTEVLIQWLQDARSIRAVEMEAGGVFQAGQRLRQQYSVMAIRGISDIVGLKRDQRWTPYACQAAAAFTYALLTANSQLFENLPPPEPDLPVPGNGARGTQADAAPTRQAAQGGSAPVKIYVSYAEKDERFKEELETHLATLERHKIISTMHSRQIGLGRDKDKEFDSQITTARIILLLVSPDFMASNYTYEQEMTRAHQRHAASQARVVPILLRPTDWENAPFSNLQGLPRNHKPVVSWKDRDQAWVEIVQGIRNLCKELQEVSTSGQPPASLIPIGYPVKAALVDKLLACSCMRNRDTRETVLNLLNEQFPGISNSIPRHNDNKTDVMEIVTRCLKYPGSLQELVSIVTFFEGESALPSQQLKAFLQSNSF